MKSSGPRLSHRGWGGHSGIRHSGRNEEGVASAGYRQLTRFYFQGLQHGFFDFETFDVDEYEHYEVCTLNYFL